MPAIDYVIWAHTLSLSFLLFYTISTGIMAIGRMSNFEGDFKKQVVFEIHTFKNFNLLVLQLSLYVC